MIVKFEQPKPRALHYHYSNRACQGALIHETAGFPESIDTAEYESVDGYQDRIRVWNPDGFEKASKMLKGSWEHSLPHLSDKQFKEFAKVLFERTTLPLHVRAIYYYNVSSGYSCSYIIAIYKRKETP